MATSVLKTADRAQRQSDRILNAAEQCFIEFGFHAASMANICEAAQMSPGLVYRYFENKGAIIKAIIERQLDFMRSDISALMKGADLVSMISELFDRRQKGHPRGISPVLYLELLAEAARNRDVEEAVRKSDTVCREGLLSWIEKQAKERNLRASEEQLQQSLFALHCFLDGLAIRVAKEPQLDTKLIQASLRQFLTHLMVK